MEMILEYLANRLEEGDYIGHLGNLEIQTQHLGCLPSNLVFEGKDRLYDIIQRVLKQYLKVEKTHWEESGYPINHIYNDLLQLKEIFKPIKND